MISVLKTLNTHGLALSILILVMGLSAGVFFGGIVPSAEKQYLIELIQNTTAQLVPAVLMNMISLLLIAIAGFTVYGFPLALIILFSRNFAVGFCDSLLLSATGSVSIIQFIFSFMLPQLLLCAVYLAVSSVTVSYALQQLRTRI